jgi:hypothetical protein
MNAVPANPMAAKITADHIAKSLVLGTSANVPVNCAERKGCLRNS